VQLTTRLILMPIFDSMNAWSCILSPHPRLDVVYFDTRAYPPVSATIKSSVAKF
jgi:hypothetical protein